MKNNVCKHHNGDFINTHCLAGVCYRDVITEPDRLEGSAYRKPCIIWGDRDWGDELQKTEYAKRGTCDKFELPTAAELAEDEAKLDARMTEIMDSIEKGVVPDGVFICGPGTIGKCACKCPESCGHVWDGEVIEDEDNGISTTTCSVCGKWQIDHDMWVAE